MAKTAIHRKPSPQQEILNDDNSKEMEAVLADQDRNILPLRVSQLTDFKRTKHYSLVTNEKLAHGWKAFVRSHTAVVGARPPILKFPRHADIHFYNHQAKYAPSESIDNRPHFRHFGPFISGYKFRESDLQLQKKREIIKKTK